MQSFIKLLRQMEQFLSKHYEQTYTQTGATLNDSHLFMATWRRQKSLTGQDIFVSPVQCQVILGNSTLSFLVISLIPGYSIIYLNLLSGKYFCVDIIFLYNSKAIKGTVPLYIFVCKHVKQVTNVNVFTVVVGIYIGYFSYNPVYELVLCFDISHYHI